MKPSSGVLKRTVTIYNIGKRVIRETRKLEEIFLNDVATIDLTGEEEEAIGLTESPPGSPAAKPSPENDVSHFLGEHNKHQQTIARKKSWRVFG